MLILLFLGDQSLVHLMRNRYLISFVVATAALSVKLIYSSKFMLRLEFIEILFSIALFLLF